MEQISIVHYQHLFDKAYCQPYNFHKTACEISGVCTCVDKRNLSYTIENVTCNDCLEILRIEKIEHDNAIATVPHCPHCGELIASVTLTFTVTKSFRFDVQTEKQREGTTP